MSPAVLKVPVVEPPELPKTTVAPPTVIKLEAASRAVNVSVALLPDTTVALETARVDVAAEMAPGLTVMDGIVVLTLVPLIVAVMVVAVPARAPVKVAV